MPTGSLASTSRRKSSSFGSYAWGESGPDSDVDIFIVKETTERPIGRRVALRNMLSDSRNRIPYDLLVVTPREVEYRLRIGDAFVEEVVEEGVELYGAWGKSVENFIVL
ncbi:MAG: nucleotidyltransferase domain-containing protein [Syntrophales bacterium]|nr:nucleotidyltransferase domain-containing protein [Syntrophales bacterium]